MARHRPASGSSIGSGGAMQRLERRRKHSVVRGDGLGWPWPRESAVDKVSKIGMLGYFSSKE